MTFTGKKKQRRWIIAHVAGNGDWQFSVFASEEEAWAEYDRRPKKGYDYRLAEIMTTCEPGVRNAWGSTDEQPAPRGVPRPRVGTRR